MDNREIRIREILEKTPNVTLSKIGDEFGVTRERARQLLVKYGIKKERFSKKIDIVCNFPNCKNVFTCYKYRPIKYCTNHKKEGISIEAKLRSERFFAGLDKKGEKNCSNCGKNLSLADFYIFSRPKRGIGFNYSHHCKKCFTKTVIEKRKNIPKYKLISIRANKKWYEKNRDRVLKRHREYWRKNKDRINFERRERRKQRRSVHSIDKNDL